MSTNFGHEPALFIDPTPSRASEAASGEFCWAIRQRDGTTLVCELRNPGGQGVEVWLFQAGKFLFGRRWDDRATALMSAQHLKTEYIHVGGTVLRSSS